MASPRITRATTRKAAQNPPPATGQDRTSTQSGPSQSSPDPSASIGATAIPGALPNQTQQAVVPPSDLSATNQEATTAEARRAILRNHQASRWSHLVARGAEPDLNNSNEVRHFEVDSHGSLTFMLLATDEAWRLREVGTDSDERGQLIAGRYYLVERLP